MGSTLIDVTDDTDDLCLAAGGIQNDALTQEVLIAEMVASEDVVVDYDEGSAAHDNDIAWTAGVAANLSSRLLL